MRLLVAEDDTRLLRSLTHILERERYLVDGVDNGEDALPYAETAEYDGLMLDIMMPGLDGVTVLKRLRQKGVGTPALFLTAKAEVADRVEGLDAGADDYLAKPFAVPELLARVRAMLRRKAAFTPDLLQAGALALNRSTYELCWQGKTQPLSGREFQVMEMLLERPGCVVSADQLLSHVWGWDSPVEVSVVWVHISNLRKKLEKLGAAANVNSIASVSQAEAEDLAQQALDENRERGWVGEYRFKVWESGEGTAVVCVSGALMLDANRAFLMAACLVFGAGSLAALLLVVVFSKGAVRPVAESHQRQRQFVTDASHELKTPLTLLQTNLDILEGDVGPNPWLSDMKEETATLTDLVRQLVGLARLDEEAPLRAEAFDLAQAVWDTASTFVPAAERQGKQLVMEGPSSLWWKGDEAALRQLVSILLDNAVKYCDPGGAIRVGLLEKRRPVLTVDNSCQHVNELPLPRLFDRFYRGGLGPHLRQRLWGRAVHRQGHRPAPGRGHHRPGPGGGQDPLPGKNIKSEKPWGAPQGFAVFLWFTGCAGPR